MDAFSTRRFNPHMLSSLPCLDARRFDWSKREKKGFAAASDLPAAPSRVWDDACDVGFLVRSPKTGKYVLFVEESARGDGEESVSLVTYASYPAGEFHITIFND